MVASRCRPKGMRSISFGLATMVSLMPTQIGYQDFIALLVRQPEVSQRARAHMMTSPFGTSHAATFSFPQPIGTAIPPPPQHVQDMIEEIRLPRAAPELGEMAKRELAEELARSDRHGGV